MTKLITDYGPDRSIYKPRKLCKPIFTNRSSFLFLFFPLILLVTNSLWGADGSLYIKFQGNTLETVKARQFNGETYLPLNFFSDILRLAVLQKDESREIQMQIAAVTISLKEDSTQVLWGKETVALSLPLREQDGMVWLPLEVASKVGLTIEERSDRLIMNWTENYLLSINNLNYMGRPAYLLRTTGRFAFNSFLLEKPDRLVIDLIGVVPYWNINCEPGEFEIVEGIRTGRFDSEKMRVVFDLSSLNGYKIVSSVEDPTNLLVVFNSTLKEVGFVSDTKEPKVFIDTTHPVQYQTTLAFNPHRVIIDICDVTLKGNALTIPGGGEWIENIRVSQFDPHTIRVVLDVKEPRGCVVTHSRKTPNRLEIKTIQLISDLEWTNNHNGGELRIRSTGEIEEEITYSQERQALILMLRHAVLSEAIKAQQSEIPLQITEEDVSRVLIEIPMSSTSGHSIQVSEDHRELRLKFKEAPLNQKLIVLDPGHGGVDAGAIGSQGVREKDINLAVTTKLRKRLEEAGAHVILTREDDQYVALYERAAIANRVGSILTLSIHSNFHPDPKVNGFEVFHHPDREDSALLGRAIFEQVIKETELKPLAVKTSKDLVVTRETQMATILIEMGFLSNYQEEALLRTEEFQNKMVEGIFQGIISYLQSNKE